MICGRCGNEFDQNDRFCQNCGAPIAFVPRMNDPVPDPVQPRVQYQSQPMYVQPQQTDPQAVEALGKARTSVILSAIGLGFSFVWYLAIVGLVLSIVGVVKSSKSRKMGYRGTMASVGKGIGITGIIISSLMMILMVVILFLYTMDYIHGDQPYFEDYLDRYEWGYEETEL